MDAINRSGFISLEKVCTAVHRPSPRSLGYSVFVRPALHTIPGSGQTKDLKGRVIARGRVGEPFFESNQGDVAVVLPSA